MEYVYGSFFLLYIISTFSPLVLSRPNMYDLSKANVHNGNSANFLPEIRSKIFSFPRWKLSFNLPSADSLTSNDPMTKIRWGRSVKNEEQLYNDEPEDNKVSYDQIKYTNTDNNKDNIVCMYPRKDDIDHLLCVSPDNITDQFYAIAEPPSEDDIDRSTKPNYTDIYLRSIRSTELGDYRVRKSKGGNFLRFGKAITFNRYDRGRDNFMRYGRSDMKRKSSLGENFVRFGRTYQDGYDSSLWQGNSFVRYGRPSNVGTRQEQVGRIAFSDHGMEIDNIAEDKWSKKDKHSEYNNPLEQKQHNRNNLLQLDRSEKEECMDDDKYCVDEIAQRFKRSLFNDCKQIKICLDSLISKKSKDNPKFIYDNFKLKLIQNKLNNKRCTKGDRSLIEKCKIYSK